MSKNYNKLQSLTDYKDLSNHKILLLLRFNIKEKLLISPLKHLNQPTVSEALKVQ